MTKSITSRPLWVNILAAIILSIVIVLLFFFSLSWLTHHGSSRTVPAVTGKTLSEAKAILDKQGFEIVIQDSVYVDTLPPSGVIKQVPEPDAVVKVNRTVYLTINRAVAPLVDMPNLVGYSFRNAENVLKNMGLKVGDTIFTPDFARNAVLAQLYEGKTLEAGTKIRQRSSVSLVLGNGVGQNEFAVPAIVGMTLGNAKVWLQSNGLNIGTVITDADVTDTLKAFIHTQKPARFDQDGKIMHIRAGQMIDVWVGVQKPITDSTQIPPPSAPVQ